MRRLIIALAVFAFVFLPVVGHADPTPQHYTVGTNADNTSGTLTDQYPNDISLAFLMTAPSADTVRDVGVRFENVQLAAHEHTTAATLTLWDRFGYRIEADVYIEPNGVDFVRQPTLDRTYLPATAPFDVDSLYPYLNRPLTIDVSALVNAAVDAPGWSKGSTIVLAIEAEVDASYLYSNGFWLGNYASGHPATLDISS